VPGWDYPYYDTYSYIQIDDCLSHTTSFPVEAAVFVDVFCGSLTITGDVAEVNVIENHGTIRIQAGGHNLYYATAYQQFGNLYVDDNVKRASFYNLWGGSFTQISNAKRWVSTINSMPNARLDILNCDDVDIDVHLAA